MKPEYADVRVRRSQDALQVFIVGLLMIAVLDPVYNGGPSPHDNVEVTVHKEDHVILHRLDVAIGGHRPVVHQIVLSQTRLHDQQRVLHALAVSTEPVVGRLVH